MEFIQVKPNFFDQMQLKLHHFHKQSIAHTCQKSFINLKYIILNAKMHKTLKLKISFHNWMISIFRSEKLIKFFVAKFSYTIVLKSRTSCRPEKINE